MFKTIDLSGALSAEDEEIILLEGMEVPGPRHLADRPGRYGAVLMDDSVDAVYARKEFHGNDVEIHARRSTERGKLDDPPESFLLCDDEIHRRLLCLQLSL
ncbi:MAG: hypothetical protein NT022_00270 [Deltaproteobacteria bacterium]|nr:hypothetical protein [Deltaproteobacteria bacterium]